MDGWTPRTVYHYDDQNRVAYTQPESEWADPYEAAILDAYRDWRANLHTCGHPLTEVLQGADDLLDEDDFVGGYQVCLACMALERDRSQTAKGDEGERERGRNPESWRLWRVDRRPDAESIFAAQHRHD